MTKVTPLAAENYNAAATHPSAIPGITDHSNEGTCQLLTLLVESTFLSYITTLDVAYIHSVSNDVMFQLHLYGDNICIEWIDTDQPIKFQQMVMELTMFIQQRCGCSFLSSSITTPQFTCHQSHEHHVTYRASVSTSMLTRQELVAVLEEWPRVHRSILLQGERLSVDNTCPIIIQSLDEEECEGPSQPESVSLSIFLATVISVAVIAMVAIALVIVFCTFRKRRKWVV